MVASVFPTIPNIFYRDEATHDIDFRKYSKPEFEFLENCDWNWVEFIPGTRVRLCWEKGWDEGEWDWRFTIGGHDISSAIPDFAENYLKTLFQQPLMEKFFGEHEVSFYGWVLGHKINNTEKYLKKGKLSFHLLDAKLGYGDWMNRMDVVSLAEMLQLPSPEELGRGSIEDALESLHKGDKSGYGNFPLFGLVLFPQVTLYDKEKDRILGKIMREDVLNGYQPATT